MLVHRSQRYKGVKPGYIWTRGIWVRRHMRYFGWHYRRDPEIENLRRLYRALGHYIGRTGGVANFRWSRNPYLR